MADYDTTPIADLPPQPVLGVSRATVGAPISPVRRLATMEPKEWEEFVAEWVQSLKSSHGYSEVHRSGGTGDLGRDVVAYRGSPALNTGWDNYQCKHYSRPLSVADVVLETGKLLYHVKCGTIVTPDRYVFVCPQGPSTSLHKCLEKNGLRQELLSRWDSVCRKRIVENVEVQLDDALRAIIHSYDFASVSIMPPLDVLDGHRATPYYAVRFGGGLPQRNMPPPAPPSDIQPNETRYVRHLLDAYGDEMGTLVASVEALATSAQHLADHLQRSREQFFSAESLRTFSRDNVPAGTFEALQDEFHDGVQEVYCDSYTSGYRRVLETVKTARQLQITGSVLVEVMQSNDRAGICHQLANDDRLVWIGGKP